MWTMTKRHIQLQQSNSAELLAYYLKTNDEKQNTIMGQTRKSDVKVSQQIGLV
jgi:hypothetical protein